MYNRVWRIDLYEDEHGDGPRRFRVALIGEQDATGYGTTAGEAYCAAEAKLVVKPGFVEAATNEI